MEGNRKVFTIQVSEPSTQLAGVIRGLAPVVVAQETAPAATLNTTYKTEGKERPRH